MFFSVKFLDELQNPELKRTSKFYQKHSRTLTMTKRNSLMNLRKIAING